MKRKPTIDEKRPRLPLEIILDVMSSLLPSKRHGPLLPRDDRAKTLLALTRVCRGTSQLAARYLIEYCWVCIGSSERLEAMVMRLRALDTSPASGRPFALGNLTSLYLAPFSSTSSITQRGANGHSTAWWMRELFDHVRQTLRRLVIDMPLRSDYDNTKERGELREGFARLVRLEEFVSVRDELFLSQGGRDAPVWTLWPELRRLALYNQDADAAFWHRIAAVRTLESVVLTRPDGVRESECCIKTEFASVAGFDRDIKIVLANVHELEDLPPTSGWSAADPHGRIKVVLHDVPWDSEDDADHVSICQEHVKTAALDGTLWNWDGHNE